MLKSFIYYLYLEVYMRKKFDKEKLLIIGILPLMWFVYFLFELFTGRIKSLYDICLNLSLLFLFAFVGFTS